jgi:hypothetical protein
MMKYKVAFNEAIAQRFGEALGSAIKLYSKNQLENKNLTELRNWLVPLLMSKQVRIV